MTADGAGWFVRHRYLLLGAVVTVLVASQHRNQQWTKDIWLHAAVVGELARHPFSPGDPLIGGVATPNEWLSPYGWLGGLVGRLTGFAPLTVLGAMAVLNTVLLLAALWWFTVTFTRNRRAPFYVLLAVLALWGPGAWRWSGFVHVDALGYVASYPATFALAVLLATLVATARLLALPTGGSRGTAIGWAVAIGAGSWLVVLCHPPSAPILALGIVAVACSRAHRPRPAALVALATALAIAAVLATAWPWFSVLDLDRTGEIREPMRILYDGPILRLAPALLGLPVIVLRSRAFPRDLLGLLLAGSALLYLGGAATGHTELGRAVATVALVLQVGLGDGLGRLEARWVDDHALPRGDWLLAAPSAVALVLGAVWLRAGPVRMVPHELWPSSVAAEARLELPVADLDPVREVVPDGATVLATGDLARELPAIGAKVVASPLWAGSGVTDAAERRTASATFFSPTASAADRFAIAERYGADAVVVDLRATDPGLVDALRAEGWTVLGEGTRVLVLGRPPT